LDFEKNVKKRTYSFTGHLITQPLITQLPKVGTGKSRSPTSNILLRSADTRKWELCVINAYKYPIHPGVLRPYEVYDVELIFTIDD